MKWTCLLLLAACNQVYGLDPTTLAEGFADTDGDELLDAVDNCPTTANTDQADRDGDARGNVCDNCSYLRNADQSDVDGDSIGDACDPHPVDAGDCLILVDTFQDPQQFAAHWTVLSETGDTPEVSAQPGFVRLRPHPPRRVGIVARDADGAMLTGVFDVLVRGRVTISNGAVISAVSNASTTRTGYSCGVRGVPPAFGVPYLVSADATGPIPYTGIISSEHVSDDYVLRLITSEPRGLALPDQCRLDYGVAVGHRTVPPARRPVGGGAGVVADTDPTEVETIALYRFGLPSCPPPLVR